jgi:myo-inositol catabolism protein IolC
LTGAYLYAKAAALAAKGRLDEARAVLADLEKQMADAAHDDGAGLNRVKDVLAVAVLAAKARIALAENKPGEAIGLLRDAVGREDRLAYSEPAD